MRREFLLLLILPLLIFVLERQGLLTPLKGGVAAAVAPMTGILTRATLSTRETVVTLRTIPQLLQENQTLRQENQELKASLADKLDLVHENDTLRNELALTARQGERKGIAAFIVGRSSTSTFGTYRINRGQRDGTEVGHVALSQGTLVGQVTEVFESTSTVMPITNVNSIIPVVLVESRGVGLLRGGTKGLTVQEISRDVPIKAGEAIVTTPLGGIVPAGIFVGTVETTAGQGADVFQTVAVASPIPFNWLDLVTVVKEQ